jgi:hypothetical protein
MVTQGSFAIFFLLVLVGGLAILAATARRNFGAIAAALLRPQPARPAPRRYTLRRRRPADLPRVARRLRISCTADLKPPLREVRIWAYERAEI